jgi:hypothetical protein
MKRFLSDFMRRGMMAWGFGPLVLAVLYWILYTQGVVDTLTVEQVCTGILSVTILAFLAGGLNAVYQIEKLPLMVAMLIHGGVLYAAYLVTYLVNSWLEGGIIPILVFTGIFIVGYFLIWAVIHAIVKRNTARVNAMLKQKQQKTENR